MKDLLSKVTVRDLERMLAIKRREESIAPLLRRRDELVRELAGLDRKIARVAGRKPEPPARDAEAAEGPGEPASGPCGRRAMSAAGRARIAAAQRARWARARNGKPVEERPPQAAPESAPGTETVDVSTGEAVPAAAVPKKKRTLSPEARARIVAAQKARWAKAKEAEKPEASPGAGDAEAAPVAETPATGPTAVPKPARKPRKKRAVEPAVPAEPAPVEESYKG